MPWPRRRSIIMDKSFSLLEQGAKARISWAAGQPTQRQMHWQPAAHSGTRVGSNVLYFLILFLPHPAVSPSFPNSEPTLLLNTPFFPACEMGEQPMIGSFSSAFRSLPCGLMRKRRASHWSNIPSPRAVTPDSELPLYRAYHQLSFETRNTGIQ